MLATNDVIETKVSERQPPWMQSASTVNHFRSSMNDDYDDDDDDDDDDDETAYFTVRWKTRKLV